MMTQALAENIRAAIQADLPEGLQGGLVTDFVVCAAVYTSDGENAFGLLAPPEMPAWTIRGILDYGHDFAVESGT